MSDRRKNSKKRKLYFAGYLCLSLVIILLAYFQLSQMAREYNTRHLELITGLYAEKMNASMEYLRNYAQDNVKVAQAMEDKTPSEVLERMEKNRDRTVFCSIGLIGENGDIYGNKYAAADICQEGLDKQALAAEEFFYSDPYQSSETGSMIVTIFVPVPDSSWLHTIYVSVKVENLRQFGVYDLLRGKISVHLLKADSENFVTCISNSSSTENFEGSWNNLLLQQKYFQYNDGYSYGLFQFSEPLRSRHQVTQNQHLPLIPDEGQRSLHGTGRKLIFCFCFNHFNSSKNIFSNFNKLKTRIIIQSFPSGNRPIVPCW